MRQAPETNPSLGSPTLCEPGPPLEGIRVVEFGQFIAVPAAGQALRDLGAEVIKIENPLGDAARHVAWNRDDFGPMFVPYNRGKKSVTLDLRSEFDRQQALALALGADVVLQNARPGALARAGLAPETLRLHNPQLIVASVSGYAGDSAFANRPGFDIAAQAESGMMSINGSSDGPPTRVGFTVVDVMASHAVTNGVLAALVRRSLRGHGATVQISLLDVAIQAQAYGWAEYGRSGHSPRRSGNFQPTAAPAADVIEAADGSVVISAYIDEHFARLASAIGKEWMAVDPRFATCAARVANRAELLEELGGSFKGYRTQVLCKVLTEAGVVAACVRNFEDVRHEPNGVSSHLFVSVKPGDSPAFPLPTAPLHVDGQDAPPSHLPAIGEHTREILDALHGTAKQGIS